MNTEMKETDSNQSNQSNHADQPVDTLKADQLTDLEPEGEVVGGIIGPTGYVLCRTTGGVVNNHNETVAEDASDADDLDDLPVTDAEVVRGGPTAHVKVFDGITGQGFTHPNNGALLNVSGNNTWSGV